MTFRAPASRSFPIQSERETINAPITLNVLLAVLVDSRARCQELEAQIAAPTQRFQRCELSRLQMEMKTWCRPRTERSADDFQWSLGSNESQSLRFAFARPDSDPGPDDGSSPHIVTEGANGQIEAKNQLVATDDRTQRHALNPGIRNSPTTHGESHVNAVYRPMHSSRLSPHPIGRSQSHNESGGRPITIPVTATLGRDQSSDLPMSELRSSVSRHSVRPVIQKRPASGNPRMLQFSR